MPRLDELQFDSNAIPDVDMANLPEEWAGFKPAPYPGPYAFQLPPEFNYEKFTAKIDGTQAERLRVVFDDAHPLTIVHASPANIEYLGQAVDYKTSNAEFPYGKDKKLASETGWLLRALKEVLPAESDNMAYAKAVAKHAYGRFRAEVEWDAYCNPERQRYVYDEATQRSVVDPNTTGCGQRYAMREYPDKRGNQVLVIPKLAETDPEGNPVERFVENFECACGAQIRCFPRLRRYAPVDLGLAERCP